MLLTQDHNANNVISFNSFEVMKQDSPSKKKNKLTLIGIHRKNFDRR